MRFVWKSLLLLVLLVPAVARAEAADDVDKARARYEAGRAAYQIGRYDDAIREFSAGWDLAQKPRFLYNLALCYRKIGDLPKARDHLRHYLSVAPANDPNRHGIEGQLADLEAELATASANTPTSASATSTPRPEPRLGAPASTAPSAEHDAGAQLTATAPPPRRSLKKQLAWIIPLSAVTAGLAIGLGVYFGTRSTCSASVGCVDAGR